MTENELKTAHQFCSHNSLALSSSEEAGCFYCKRFFSPADVVKWVESGNTALCPHCGIDSVIGSISTRLTPQFLEEMNRRWFSAKNAKRPEDIEIQRAVAEVSRHLPAEQHAEAERRITKAAKKGVRNIGLFTDDEPPDISDLYGKFPDGFGYFIGE